MKEYKFNKYKQKQSDKLQQKHIIYHGKLGFKLKGQLHMNQPRRVNSKHLVATDMRLVCSN